MEEAEQLYLEEMEHIRELRDQAYMDAIKRMKEEAE